MRRVWRANLTGQQFGRWTIEGPADSARRTRRWHCLCACGKRKIVHGQSLVAGRSTSCGCRRAELRTASARATADRVGRPWCQCDGTRMPGRRRCRGCTQRWTKYRLTTHDYFAMLANQAGLCGICTTPMSPGRGTHVDHDHETGRVRMLLCALCNTLVGHTRESPLLLAALDEYVARFKPEIAV